MLLYQTMKLLVLSDLHLEQQADKAKLRALEKLLIQVDRVIINGDFWDRYLTTFDQFVKSDWAKLFPLLKQKHTVYLFGNHDPKQLTDKRINYFCTESGFDAEMKIGNRQYHFEHGHRLKPPSWLLDSLAKFSYALTGRHLTTQVLVWIQQQFISIFGINFYQQLHRGGNKNILSKWQKERKNQKNLILVCGHTHSAILNRKLRYINTGLCRFGYLQFLIICKQKISLETIRY